MLGPRDIDAAALPFAGKRVAVVLYRLARGGAERGMVNLIKGLCGRGVAVDLLLCRGGDAYRDELPDGVRIIRLEPSGRWAVLWAMLRAAPRFFVDAPWLWLEGPPRDFGLIPALRDYLCRERPDALLSALATVNLAAILARAGADVATRLVVREANTLSQNYRDKPARADRALPGLAARWYPKADVVVTVAAGVAADLEALGVPTGKLRTIHNGLDLERIAEAAAGPVDHPFYAAGVPVILAIGRLQPQKDHATLIAAFAQMRQSRDCRLVILGEGPLRAALEAQIAELGLGAVVDLVGEVANPFARLARSALLVLPSRWEGFPNVLLEALACRCPIVATDCPSGGPAELLADGRYGRLVPPGDPAAMARAMDEALERPGDLEAGCHYASGFSVERSTEHYLEALLPTVRTSGAETTSCSKR